MKSQKKIEAELESAEDWLSEECDVEKLYDSALELIHSIHTRIAHGDVFAVHALVDLGSQIAMALEYERKGVHETQPGFQAVSKAAGESYHWPAMIPAMEEMRDPAAAAATPENLGGSLPIKAEKRRGKGSTRVFHNSARTGYAYNVFCSLEFARRENALPDFTAENLDAWVAAGFELVDSSQWLFPYTVEMEAAVKMRGKSVGQAEGPARAHVIEKMLRAGFSQLLKE